MILACSKVTTLTTESIERPSLTLQCIHNVKRSDGFAFGVLGVRDGITDDTLEKCLQDTTSLLVDHYLKRKHVFGQAW